MTDTHARARVWTLCLAALMLAVLTGPLVALLTPLAHASAPRWPMLPHPAGPCFRARPARRGHRPCGPPRRRVVRPHSTD